jgi:hypothetical protein
MMQNLKMSHEWKCEHVVPQGMSHLLFSRPIKLWKIYKKHMKKDYNYFVEYIDYVVQILKLQ